MIEIFAHSLRQLWEGAVLGSIAHAVAVSRLPAIAHEQSWDGAVYNVQDSFGSRGTVCFELDEFGFPARCAGAVFSPASDRRRLVDGIPVDPSRYFSEAGSECISLAQQAFQYLLDDFHGRNLPWITSGFWAESNECRSQDTWTTFLLNGGHLLERQFGSFDQAIHDWIKVFSMSSSEVDLVRSLYNQKIILPNDWMTLTHEQLAMIENNKAGIDESRESFAELRIKLS